MWAVVGTPSVQCPQCRAVVPVPAPAPMGQPAPVQRRKGRAWIVLGVLAMLAGAGAFVLRTYLAGRIRDNPEAMMELAFNDKAQRDVGAFFDLVTYAGVGLLVGGMVFVVIGMVRRTGAPRA